MKQAQIEETLLDLFQEAEEKGLSSIIIKSGDLNNQLPFSNESNRSYYHACCNAMNKFFRSDKDKLIRTSDSGQTSNHIIEYGLPRDDFPEDLELSDLIVSSDIEIDSYEDEYNRNYPKQYVAEISIKVNEWKELLEDETIFFPKDIELLKKIYRYPHHAVTCTELSAAEGKKPQAYNKPVVSLARRIKIAKELEPIYGTKGVEVFWRIIFWGRTLSNSLFEWKIRPELAKAMQIKWPELDTETINKNEDLRYVEEVANSPLENLPAFSNYIGKPRNKAEKILVSNQLIYPRDRKVAFNALAKANCCCEFDKTHKSFICKHSGRKYLEIHHLIPLSFADSFVYSIDIEENLVALCSNCHNEIHYGVNAERIIKKLYEERKEALKKAGIEITLEWLVEKYK